MEEMKTKDLYKHYEERFKEHGYSYKTLGWGSVETQMLRFKVLADIANFADKSVCDIGCGFGDLYPYLKNRFGIVNYYGMDICPTLIGEAKKQFPEASFEVRNILENPPERKFDYVLASGVLNFKTGPNHLEYLENMVKTMFGMCTEGLAVNFLSKYVDYEMDKDFHYSPEEALKMAMKLSRWATLCHNYPLYEFTLYIYRNPNPHKRP